MKKLFPVLLVGGLGAIGLSLYRYYKKQVEFLKNIDYRVTGLKIVSIQKENVSLEITTIIYNASNIEAKIKQINLQLLLNGIPTGKIEEVRDILIAPNSSSELSFVSSFNPTIIGKNILNILTLSVALRDVDVSVVGDVKLQSAFVQATLPFQYRNNLKSIIKR
jgi:LEA14-like dessication related protein